MVFQFHPSECDERHIVFEQELHPLVLRPGVIEDDAVGVAPEHRLLRLGHCRLTDLDRRRVAITGK